MMVRSIVFSRMSVCRLSARIPRKLHGWTIPNFLRMLTTVVSRYSSDGVGIRYVLPVLWVRSHNWPYCALLCIPSGESVITNKTTAGIDW